MYFADCVFGSTVDTDASAKEWFVGIDGNVKLFSWHIDEIGVLH